MLPALPLPQLPLPVVSPSSLALPVQNSPIGATSTKMTNSSLYMCYQHKPFPIEPIGIRERVKQGIWHISVSLQFLIFSLSYDSAQTSVEAAQHLKCFQKHMGPFYLIDIKICLKVIYHGKY